MPLLKVTHQQQQRSSDCLAACAAMALNHLGVQIRYNTISLNDPAFVDSPKTVERILFESAWLRCDYICAVIQQRKA